ncbi:putative adhesin [Psychrobacter sp. M13]|uniref:putative adhesin n=1 Tax=Psychrobacter sp. M13 TaxID=3067275 RepID=UPI00273B00B5|nr:hypothetical protein [Psychrobacter sp. M13]WLP95286.1 hypothetical protein Q9G97_04045 [Psychrobacter sp. M13]
MITGQDSLAGVNRDAFNTETIITDRQTGGLAVDTGIDTRVFTSAGREEIVKEQRELGKNVKGVVAITGTAGLAVPSIAAGLLDNGNSNPDSLNKSGIDKAKDNVTQLVNNLETGMSDDTVNLTATVEAIQEGELTNSIDNQDTLNNFNTAITEGTDADGTKISLVDDPRNVDGIRVRGTTNVDTGQDTFIDTSSMSSVVEVINHDAAHQNGQGEAAADVMGQTGNRAFNLGKWANSGAIAEERTTITPRPITSTNDAKAQQEQLASNKEKLEAQQEAGDAFEDDTDTWTYNGNSAPSTNAEMRALNNEAKRLFPNSTADQEAYKAGKESAFGSSVVNAGQGLVEIARDPKSAITNSFRGMINVLTDPNKAGQEMRAAIIQWKDDYNKALKDNPKLAGKMRGELEDAVGFGVVSTVLTGGSANALKTLQQTGKFESRGVLGDNNGSGNAKEVIHGGNGQAISGHGYYDFRMTANRELIVPEGTTVITAPFNTKISDTTGRFMEGVNADKLGRVNANQRVQMAKDWAKQNNITGRALTRLKNEVKELQVYKPGSTMPNYSISPPERLTIHKNSTTVGVTTNLDQILKPNKGCIPLATCTETIKR